jgi:hypothetical protein
MKIWVWGPMGSIGCVRSDNFRRDFVALTNALIEQFGPFCTKVRAVTKRSETPKTWVWIQMGWIGCVRCEKFRHDFVARTCALIAHVRPVFLRSSCTDEKVQNIPKHQFEYNRVDRVRSLRKIPTQLRCTNLCINCTCSARFAPKFLQ